METLQIIIWIIAGGGFIIFLALVLYFNVFEKSDNKDKGDKPISCLLKLLLCVLIVIAFFFILGRCGGGNAPWKPRHTQLIQTYQKNC